MAAGALAQQQFEAGEIGLARKTVADAIAERDDIVALQLLRGRIELAAHAPANAFTAYSNALSLDSANAEALLGVAQLGLQTGRLRESEDAADRMLTLTPNEPNALIIKGLHNIIRRRYEATLANAEAVLAVSPNDEGASILKARSLALLGRSDEAFAVIEKARKVSGETRGIALTVLELNRQRGDGPAMVPQLERLRQLDPNDRNLVMDEADTLYKLGQMARARAILQQAMLTNNLDEATATRLTALWAEYDSTPLEAAVSGQVAAHAGLPARKAIARYFLDRNDPAQAGAVLVGAAPIDDVTALRARIAVAQGRVDEGFDLATAILSRDNTHCDALLAQAQADLARGRMDDAVVASQRAINSCPQMVQAYLLLAKAHQLKQSAPSIAIAFRDGFERNGQDSRLARAYTAWLVQTGRGERALGIGRRLTGAAPSLISGWKLYLELCSKVPDAGCKADAEAGLANAWKRFGVDPRSGELPPTGLFGRIQSR